MKWVLLETLFLLGLAAYVLAGREAVPFHGDESMLIAMSRDYYYLVQTRNLEPVLYDPNPAPDDLAAAVDHHLRIVTGTISKMTIGLAWDLAGMTADDLNGPWIWGVPDEWAWNQDHHNRSSTGSAHRPYTVHGIYRAERDSVFGIARRVVPGRWGAWAAALIYATHPAVLVNGRRAMMEGSLLLFSALVILIALWVERDLLRATRYRVVWFVMLGVASGLALASKHSAVITVAAVFSALALAPLRDKVPLSRRGGACSALAGEGDLGGEAWKKSGSAHGFRVIVLVFGAAALALLTFLALNPAWWRDPLRMPGRVLDERSDLLNAQIESARAFGADYTSLGDRLAGLVDQIASPGRSFTRCRSGRNMWAQTSAYRAAWYAGRGGGLIWESRWRCWIGLLTWRGAVATAARGSSCSHSA
jgi:hypothetical protein